MSNPAHRRISQMHIAKELGYSQALVSMVLNGRKKGISKTASKRIWDYAIHHGYSPRGMRMDSIRETSQAKTIGYILRSPLKLANKSNFFNHIHQGLHDHLDQHGIKTVFIGSEDDIMVERLSTAGTVIHQIRGIAIMGEVQPAFLEGVIKLGLPIVYISARAPGKCHSILSNEGESTSMLVDHLCGLGHTTFAWLGGNRFMGRHHDRYRGVVQALQRHDLAIEDKFVTKLKGADRKEGFEAAKQIAEASEGDLPTAWICLNGMMARGAISFLFQNGYRIPEDLSIAAIDMTNVCSEENPTITCASAFPEDMGSEAGRLLLESLNKSIKSLIDLTLPSQFRELDSTGPVPTEKGVKGEARRRASPLSPSHPISPKKSMRR